MLASRSHICRLSMNVNYEYWLPLQAAQLRPGIARAYVLEPFWIEACYNSQMRASVMLHACHCSKGSFHWHRELTSTDRALLVEATATWVLSWLEPHNRILFVFCVGKALPPSPARPFTPSAQEQDSRILGRYCITLILVQPGSDGVLYTRCKRYGVAVSVQLSCCLQARSVGGMYSSRSLCRSMIWTLQLSSSPARRRCMTRSLCRVRHLLYPAC